MTQIETQIPGDLAVGLPTRLLAKGKVAPVTLEEIAAALDELPPEAVPIPPMCDRHAEELERELAKVFGGAVVAPYMVVTCLVFQIATSDAELWAQSANVAQLGRILSLGGCHACRYPRGFRAAVRIVRRKGLHFGAGLSRNECVSANWRPDVFAVDRR